MSGEEQIEAEEIEEVTRCVCGNVDLKIEDDFEDTGLFVQCDKCLVWQHGYCVGLLNDDQVPETYYCELCRPDLHKLIQRPRRLPRSKFLGVENASSPPPVPPSTHDDLAGIMEEVESSSSKKRRSTMNSRDAAYDRQLEAALLLSAQQNGTAPEMPAPSISGRSGRTARRQSPPPSKRGRTPSPSPSRDDSKQKRRRKAGVGSAIKREEASEPQASAAARRRGGKKKGVAASTATEASEEQETTTMTDAANPPSSSSSRPRSANADRTPVIGASVQDNDSRPPSRAVSRESTPVAQITGASRKRGSARNSKKSGPPAVSRGNTVSSAIPPSTPSGKVAAMSEMRKRVSAILEYVGRMQEEMATEVTEWSQFVPQEEFALVENKQRREEDSVWGYGYGEGGSVSLMEDLTGNLLRWESLYG